MTARIIVADSIATTRITLKVRLVAACYEVLTAATSAQLHEQMRAGRPHLVILASGLADCPVASLCESLKAEWPGVPVLVLASAETRLDALRAGASAVLEPTVQEQMLLARIRTLLRDTDAETWPGVAEAAANFDHQIRDHVTLVADSASRAMRWRHGLQAQLACQFAICNPDEALSAATSGQRSDLYLIAADIEGRGDGLRLLSELRARSGSRDAAFIVATRPEREELQAIALDLGAGEVLPIDLGSATDPELGALAVQGQLQRKHDSDRKRAEARRAMLWAMTDPLTGLHNRRHAMPRLVEIAAEAQRGQSDFAVMVLDLDRFKSINDRYGHAAGDAVLCGIARRLRGCVPTQGLTARHGGEEFLVVLPDCSEASAWHIAERMRLGIESNPVALPNLSGGGQVSITVSIGLAIVAAKGSNMPAEMLADLSLERADQALIRAKQLGRNRVVLARNETMA